MGIRAGAASLHPGEGQTGAVWGSSVSRHTRARISQHAYHGTHIAAGVSAAGAGRESRGGAGRARAVGDSPHRAKCVVQRSICCLVPRTRPRTSAGVQGLFLPSRGTLSVLYRPFPLGGRCTGRRGEGPCFPRAAVPVRWAVRGEASPRVRAGGLRFTEASRLREESDPDDCRLFRRRFWRRNVRRGPDPPPAVGGMAHDPSLVHFRVFALTISSFLVVARE